MQAICFTSSFLFCFLHVKLHVKSKKGKKVKQVLLKDHSGERKWGSCFAGRNKISSKTPLLSVAEEKFLLNLYFHPAKQLSSFSLQTALFFLEVL